MREVKIVKRMNNLRGAADRNDLPKNSINKQWSLACTGHHQRGKFPSFILLGRYTPYGVVTIIFLALPSGI